ncbi:MAG: aminoacyl-histidine dipeptidase [Saprospiraceae bacterium]|uniref:Cytosol non-specific dipeptidase n=1 Tax=Candidatus Defluviibacterium haderslevense TaxID=2981993 RepID=A0A9D7SDE2_9BACT|nr:aminoacyl-histidine dipeptidase [Candidatus Defluviibacterium haderslevense]MBL0236544.1 aminoacyl-histidine dipeptidase [Candidatus Defluviibacterium haderslevense]
MSTSLRDLEPKELWNHFADLNAVPRPSKKEERVIEFMIQFGKKLGLETFKDEIGNVIIKKPATKGLEHKKTIVLQSHLDMVHQKNANTIFDFNTQGIEMIVDGDWVKAKGTTLGADNGIGVATIMSLLESKRIPHPAVEALFTIDEETGMTGALNLKGGLLKGSILLNLDTEDDNELTIGCAGGIDVTASGKYEQIPPSPNGISLILHIKGLTGGHSGMDIYKGRGNANKLMNRILSSAWDQFGVQINFIDGGSLRNAIPRESTAGIVVSKNNETEFKNFILFIEKELQAEHQTTDPNLCLQIENSADLTLVFKEDFQSKLLNSLYACPNGIYRMSPDILHLVQSSNNLARVLVKDGLYTIQCLTRSSVDTEKMDLAMALKYTFKLMDAKIDFSGSYPGWTPKPEATIVQLMSTLYKEMNADNALVSACHAGLECGILGSNYPNMEMISFGPNIRGAHSPDEKVQISSVQKFWNFFLEVLNRIPDNPHIINS